MTVGAGDTYSQTFFCITKIAHIYNNVDKPIIVTRASYARADGLVPGFADAHLNIALYLTLTCAICSCESYHTVYLNENDTSGSRGTRLPQHCPQQVGPSQRVACRTVDDVTKHASKTRAVVKQRQLDHDRSKREQIRWDTIR